MIDTFTGPNRFLSNFYPCLVYYNGILYPSVEHAYQAQKTTLPSEQLTISKLATPAQAKKMGREVKCRRDWEEVKVAIMRDLLLIKFAEQELLQKLLATEDAELIEGNWWGDRFWGVCHGGGKNTLGTLLMEVREQYRDALRETVAEREISED